MANDIAAYSKDNSVKTIYIDSDFLNIFSPADLEKIFSRRYNLNLHYRFWSFNGDYAAYQYLSESFLNVRVYLPIYYIRGGVKENAPISMLSALLAQVKNLPNIHMTLIVNAGLKSGEKTFLREINTSYANILLRADYDILIKVPTQKDHPEEFARYYSLSRRMYSSIPLYILGFLYRCRRNRKIHSLLFRLYYYIHKKIIFNAPFSKLFKILLHS